MYQHSPARKAALGFALACAMAGCAPLSGAQHDTGGVTQKALLDFNSCAKPMYPESDLRERHQGTVALAFKVGQDGKASASNVQHSSGFPGLDEAARVALEKCSFKPALKDGQPVEAWTLVQYVWTLG
jgi:TonB family protein